jgi:hypothetical protein
MFSVFLCVVMFGTVELSRSLSTSPIAQLSSQAIALAAPSSGAAPSSLTESDLKDHRTFLQRLSPSQQKALAKVYPDFKILSLCAGRYTGGNREELVMGIWKPMKTPGATQRAVHRVGLIWQRNGWVMHNIDTEIEKDRAISRSIPMGWAYEFTAQGFVGGMKCNANLAKDPQLNTKPLFSLKSKGLQNNQTLCFATSYIYNNWDCLVFSPKDNRFRLWMQQVYAD